MSNPLRLKVVITPGSFTGKTHFLTHNWNTDVYDRANMDQIRSKVGITSSLLEANIAMFPFNLSSALENPAATESLHEIVEENAINGLRTVCVLSHDYSQALDVGQPQALVLRSSMISSQRYREEFAIPVVTPTNDFPSEIYSPRGYDQKPRIGFMGAVPLFAMAPADQNEENVKTKSLDRFYGFERIDPTDSRVVKSPVNIGAVVRSRAIKALASSQLVTTDFVLRDSYFGFMSQEDRVRNRIEYVEHLMRNDYILCPRGAGNFSFRLFETMASGRIPILIDTDLVMPFADRIPWHEIAVWVPLKDIDHVDTYVNNFHKKLGAERHLRLQSYLREFFREYISRDGLNSYLEKFLLERL